MSSSNPRPEAGQVWGWNEQVLYLVLAPRGKLRNVILEGIAPCIGQIRGDQLEDVLRKEGILLAPSLIDYYQGGLK